MAAAADNRRRSSRRERRYWQRQGQVVRVKAVLLAAAMCVMYIVAVTAGFYLARPEALRARFMVILFLWTVPLGLAIHLMTPGDLGFLPAAWCEPNHFVDRMFFLFMYAAAFFGFILQLYNLADRGFSLRIVIDIDESPAGCMTIDQVMDSYSAGQGITWMYQKRLDDLIRLKLIV